MAAKRKSISKKKMVGVGIASAAVVAAAAGTYFLYGSKNAARNRKVVKSWALKAKAEVLEGLEKAKRMSEEDYKKIVSAALKKYSKLAGSKEVKKLERELHSHWKHLSAKGKGTAKKAKRKAKKVVRKASRKATRKRK